VNAKAHREDCAEQLRNRSSFDIPPTSLEPAKKINCYTELDSENDALGSLGVTVGQAAAAELTHGCK